MQVASQNFLRGGSKIFFLFLGADIKLWGDAYGAYRIDLMIAVKVLMVFLDF